MTKKRIIILVSLCGVVFLLSFWISSETIKQVYASKNDNANVAVEVSAKNIDNITKNTIITIKDRFISAYNSSDKKETIKQEYANASEMKLKDANNQLVSLVGQQKSKLINKTYEYNGKKYYVLVENNNVMLNNVTYERKYILKIENNKIVVYSYSGAGLLKKEKDTDINLQKIQISNDDLLYFDQNRIQSDNKDNLEEALSDYSYKE